MTTRSRAAVQLAAGGLWLARLLLLLTACGGESTAVSTQGDSAEVTGGGGEQAPGMQVLFEGEDGPLRVAVDDEYVYWSTRDALRRGSLSGAGEPSTLAVGSYVRGFVIDGEYVYFAESAESSGSIQRVRRTGGDPEWISDAGSPWGMAISNGVLYWTDPGSADRSGVVMRAELDGLRVTPVARELYSPGDIAVDDEFIYFWSTAESCFADTQSCMSGCSGGGIWRLPKAGGSAERLHPTSASGAIVLHQDALYWPAESSLRIMSAPLGGSERQLVNVVEGIGDLHSDGRALYWATGERVLRVSFDDVEVLRLVAELEEARSVAVHGDWAYVAERNTGRILRVATDGSANRPAGPITGPCPAPLGTANERALTPRADQNLERLALSLEPGRLTASSSVYDRVVADVAALRALAPEFADIPFFAPHDGKTLSVTWTDVGAQSVRSGEYSAWDCLHEAYGLTSMTPLDVFDSASTVIELHGIYDMTLIAELYAQLPAVKAASAELYGGGGSTLCAARDGARHEYVVDEATGGLYSGERHAHLFTSDAPGAITPLADWNSESGEPPPEWFVRICR